MLEVHESETGWIRGHPDLHNTSVIDTDRRRTKEFTSLIGPYLVNTRSTSFRETPAAKSET